MTNAGTLYSQLTTAGNLTTVTDLTITGNIDARDFNTLTQSCTSLINIDISGTTIIGYTGTEGTGGKSNISYPANEVPIYAFNNKHTIITIKLPTTATSIGNNVLQGCWNLPQVTIPNSVTIIKSYAFASCPKLSSITLSTQLRTINSNAFSYLYKLESITIPASVTTIEPNAFSTSTGNVTVDASNPNYASIDGVLYNKAITSLIHVPTSKTGDFTIPSTVKRLEFESFANINIGTLFIPASTTDIHPVAFYKFKGYFTVAPSNPAFSSIDGVLCNKNLTEIVRISCSKTGTYTTPAGITSIASYAFENSSLTEVILSSGVQTIGTGAFGSSNIKSVKIPSSVTSINNMAFWYCGNLTSIFVESTTPIALTESSLVFSNVNKNNCTLFVPAGSLGAYSSAAVWQSFTKIIEGAGFSVPTTVSMLAAAGTNTFYVNSNITCSFSCDANWLTLDKSTITGNGTVTLTAEENPTLTARTANITVSGQGVTSKTVTITQAASLPKLSVAESAASLGNFAGSTATINVSSNTSWSASVNNTWLTISPSSATGNGIISVTAEANTSITPRTATVTISATGTASKLITITQAAGNPTLTLSASSGTIGSFSDSRSSVKVKCNTTWTATNNAAWLTLSNTSYTGDNTIIFTATANPEITTRTATITISATGTTPQTYTLTQDAGQPVVTITNKTVSVGSTANSSINVSIASNTQWNTSGYANWLSVTPSTATGNGTITLTAQANPATETRTTYVLVNASGTSTQTITVTQAASSPSLSISSTTISLAKEANSQAAISISSNTSWSSTNNGTWLSVSPGIGKGNAQVTFIAKANPTISPREATVIFTATGTAPQVITVTQSAGTPVIDVMSSAISINKLNPSPTVEVTSNTTWSASTNETWLSTTPTSATGNGTLTFSAEANPTVATRSAIVTISAPGALPKTITVTQSAGAATLSISPTNISFDKTSNNTGTILVTSNTNWTTSQNAPWLTLSPRTGTGNATLIISPSANPTTATRSATVTFTATGATPQVVTVTQAAGDATLSVLENAISLGKTANSNAMINVTSNTTWSVNSNANWLTSNTTLWTGSKSLTVTAAANPTTEIRRAIVTISANGVAPHTISITQEAGDPTLTLSATTASVSKTKNSTASISVTSNTTWNASVDALWLTLNATESTGNRTLTITADANPTTSTRTATVTISATGLSPQTIKVTQAAGDPTLTVSATNIAFESQSGINNSTTITSNTTWQVSSNQTWLTVTPLTLAGDGVLNINASANENNAARTATITISGNGVPSIEIKVTQAAKTPTGINNSDQNLIQIYPNPTTDGFIITTDPTPSLLTITDLKGKLVLRQTVENQAYVDISTLTPGIYIVYIKNKIMKVIKK
jgi:hypothetical protein